jgi:hypothetical protein
MPLASSNQSLYWLSHLNTNVRVLHVYTGVSLNYWLDQGLNDARVLFPGMACAAIAIVTGGFAHIENQKHLARKQQAKQQGQDVSNTTSVDMVMVADAELGTTKDVTVPPTKKKAAIRDAEFLSVYNPNRCVEMFIQDGMMACVRQCVQIDGPARCTMMMC